MKTLVIHPKDSTTAFLTEIYSDKDWSVINTNTSKKILKDKIKAHDRVVMLGHGTELGLIGFGRLVIDSSWVYLLREKECVCIWCNADLFVLKYGLRGFYTGMIISESDEAEIYLPYPYTHKDIDDSNSLFAETIKKSFDVDVIKMDYKSDTNAVIMFNKDNLYYEAVGGVLKT